MLDWIRKFYPLLLATAITGQAAAQATAPASSQDNEHARFVGEQATYHTMPDAVGTGPFPAVELVDPAFPNHVIYRPADMKKLGSRKLPVLLWGNGGCSDNGASERLFLAEIASHGYLAIAPGYVLTGPEMPPPPPPTPPSEFVA